MKPNSWFPHLFLSWTNCEPTTETGTWLPQKNQHRDRSRRNQKKKQSSQSFFFFKKFFSSSRKSHLFNLLLLLPLYNLGISEPLYWYIIEIIIKMTRLCLETSHTMCARLQKLDNNQKWHKKRFSSYVNDVSNVSFGAVCECSSSTHTTRSETDP